MLYDRYVLKEHQTVNFKGLATDAPYSIRFQSMELPTLDPEVFDRYSLGYMRELFDIQMKKMETELNMQIKYSCIGKMEADRTRNQYRQLFFYEDNGKWYAFLKEDILNRSRRQDQLRTPVKSEEVVKELFLDEFRDDKESTATQKKRPSLYVEGEEGEVELTDEDLDDSNDPRPKQVKPHPVLLMNQDNTIGVSIKAIREITGYSYRVKMPWHDDYVSIIWQKEMMDDQSNILVVDGSRQGGKSKGIAQKLVEESFVVGADMMVAAALQETTEAIWDYMMDYIENFDEGDFTIKERKRYIQNNISGTRVHFRTLLNGAKGIRGKTLRLIVVDEAMLISTDIFESILLPTQTAIQNPRLILLGTASENTSCFMYRTIMDIRRGLMYNNPGQLTAKYIKFSVNENPLVSPVMKRNIIDKKEDPRVQREYFNKWGKLEDSLFRPKVASITDLDMNTEYWLVISIDPARKQDRSGYAVFLCGRGKAQLLESGEVPPEYKSQWKLQALFFTKLRNRYSRFPNYSCAGDETGVGDGAFSTFESETGFVVKYRIRYTSGDDESESQDKTEYKVGKSLLINNLIDCIDEDVLIVPAESNGLFLEECDHIQATTTRTGKIAFTTVFTDDVINAVLVGLYVIKKKQYHLKVYASKRSEENSFRDEMTIYRPKKKTKSNVL